jgi:hypothetical protein
MSWIQRLEALDQRWSQALRVDDHRLGKIIASVAAHFGDGPLWLALWIAGIILFQPPRRWQIALWLLTSIIAAVVTYSIKFALKRPRPRKSTAFTARAMTVTPSPAVTPPAWARFPSSAPGFSQNTPLCSGLCH